MNNRRFLGVLEPESLADCRIFVIFAQTKSLYFKLTDEA